MSTTTPTPAEATVKKVTKKAPHETFCAAPRVRAIIEKGGAGSINAKASRSIAELKAEIAPDVEQEGFLKSGKKVVKDASGKPVKNADGTVQEAALTDAERTTYDNARKAFSARRAEIDANIKLFRGAKYRISSGLADLLAAYTDDATTELFQFAFDMCLLNGKKIVLPSFFIGEGIENLMWYQLVSRTAAWRKLASTKDYEDAEATPATAGDKKANTGSIEFCIRKLVKEMISPLVTNTSGTVVMEQKEKKRKGPDGAEVTDLVWAAKRDSTGKYGQLRLSNRALKFVGDLVVELYQIIAAQLLLRLRVKTITADDLSDVVQSALDLGLPTTQDFVFGQKDVVDPEARKTNAALPADQRKKESELPKVRSKTVDVVTTVVGSRFARVEDRIRPWRTAYDAHQAERKAVAEKAAATKKAAVAAAVGK